MADKRLAEPINDAEADARESDRRNMLDAIRLASKALGTTAPNPAVGCIITLDGRVVGRGWTQPSGRPHAEAVALTEAAGAARGATAFVTLEPCSHYGLTLPCAYALVAAGIKRVVVAVPRDPDERVRGRGIDILIANGVHVEVGLLHELAVDINLGFFSRILRDRPYVVLKLATSLDGRIGFPDTDNRWITCETSRHQVHIQRSNADAVLTGVGTILSDNPRLTHREIDPLRRQPLRVILDSKLRTPIDSEVVKSSHQVPSLVVAVDSANCEKTRDLEHRLVEILFSPTSSDGRVDISWVLTKLASRGINLVMVEAGTSLTTEMLVKELADEIIWYKAPIILGNASLPVAGDLQIPTVDRAIRLKRVRSDSLSQDLMDRYVFPGGFRDRLIEGELLVGKVQSEGK